MPSEARDIPINMSDAKVLALLDGRKTQERIVLKPQPKPFQVDDAGTMCDIGVMHPDGDPRPRITIGRVITMQEVRYAVGDRLWVRETHARADLPPIWYRADFAGDTRAVIWKPSTQMKRHASRLTLIVESVKVEQLHDINEENAESEGVVMTGRIGWEEASDYGGTYRYLFAYLWNSLHTKPGERWEDNPLVVAMTFAVHRCNIDEME